MKTKQYMDEYNWMNEYDDYILEIDGCYYLAIDEEQVKELYKKAIKKQKQDKKNGV